MRKWLELAPLYFVPLTVAPLFSAYIAKRNPDYRTDKRGLSRIAVWAAGATLLPALSSEVIQ